MPNHEAAYQAHLKREAQGCDADEHLHPDGCFYCGGDHPSDCCPNDDTVDEHWDD